MKLFCSLLGSIALAAAAFAGVNPQLLQVKRVYILSMGSGMDQFLANQLTTTGVFEVVTDPKKADAIVTDNVGEAFQKKLDDLYPPPPKPEAAKTQAEATRPAADSDSSIDVGDNSASDAKPGRKNAFEGVDFSGGGARSSSFGRGKGNFFVVERNSRIVLWSVYERPKDSTPGELTKTASRVVKHLKEDMTGKKPVE
jgi:hypothetical protein